MNLTVFLKYGEIIFFIANAQKNIAHITDFKPNQFLFQPAAVVAGMNQVFVQDMPVHNDDGV